MSDTNFNNLPQDEQKQDNQHGESISIVEEERIIVKRARIPSLFDEVLIEFGKELVKGSISQALEFNKTMLGLTATFSTLMAASFGILAFGVRDQMLDEFSRIFLVVPVFLMLLSSISFSVGYFPRHVKIKLQTLESIKKTRDTLFRTRKRWAYIGIIFFILSIISLLIGIIFINVWY